MKGIWNFSAGPAVLPRSVLREAAAEMENYRGWGMSVMEMSHRSEAFGEIIGQAEQDLRALMHIPQNYHVLFLQGGATGQFAAVPMNFMKNRRADYIITGFWSERAYTQAQRYGDVRVVATSADRDHSYIPDCTDLPISRQADYVYICENDTAHGTQFFHLPETKGKPLVADLSSCLLSAPVETEKYAMLFAGTQKNAGIAGLTIAVVREDMMENGGLPETPGTMQYQNIAKNRSMFQTPPTYPIYICGKVLQWIRRQGGLEEMKRQNRKKAALLYDYLDESRLFHPLVEPPYRSMVNVTFTTGVPQTNTQLASLAEKEGFIGLKGHRAVGGLRASLYNAMPYEGVERLVDLLHRFEKSSV